MENSDKNRKTVAASEENRSEMQKIFLNYSQLDLVTDYRLNGGTEKGRK